jgi:hypothetical protein
LIKENLVYLKATKREINKKEEENEEKQIDEYSPRI